MLRTRIILTVLLLVFGSQGGFAQFAPSLHGHLGTAHLAEPSALGKGGFVVGGSACYTDLGRKDPRGEIGAYGLHGTLGLTPWLDAGLSVSYLAVNAGVGGLGRTSVSLKFAVTPEESELSLGLLVGAMLPPVDPDPLVSSRGTNPLTRILAGWEGRDQWLLANAGIERMDVLWPSTQRLRSEYAFVAGLAYGRTLRRGVMGFVELVGASIPSLTDEDLFFQAGLDFPAAGRLRARFSGGTGLPNFELANTDVRITAGLQHRLERVD
jgi:hypothetical protein